MLFKHSNFIGYLVQNSAQLRNRVSETSGSVFHKLRMSIDQVTYTYVTSLSTGWATAFYSFPDDNDQQSTLLTSWNDCLRVYYVYLLRHVSFTDAVTNNCLLLSNWPVYVSRLRLCCATARKAAQLPFVRQTRRCAKKAKQILEIMSPPADSPVIIFRSKPRFQSGRPKLGLKCRLGSD